MTPSHATPPLDKINPFLRITPSLGPRLIQSITCNVRVCVVSCAIQLPREQGL